MNAATPLQILLAQPRGFCAGVTRANFGQGQQVTILGYHAKDSSNFAFMRKMTFADGHSEVHRWVGNKIRTFGKGSNTGLNVDAGDSRGRERVALLLGLAHNGLSHRDFSLPSWGSRLGSRVPGRVQSLVG